MMIVSVTAFAGGEDATNAACDIDRGKKIFQKCAICHSFDSSGEHLAGPNLYQIAGRTVGKVEGFKFSRKLRKSEDVWTRERLDAFLEAPLDYYPGMRMAFAGLKKSEDRMDLICYLESP